jgi:hypothetical protein
LTGIHTSIQAEAERRRIRKAEDGNRRKQQRSKGATKTEAEKETKRRAQKKREIYKAAKGRLCDDTHELQMADSEFTAGGMKRMPEWEIRAEGAWYYWWRMPVPHDCRTEYTDDEGLDEVKADG